MHCFLWVSTPRGNMPPPPGVGSKLRSPKRTPRSAIGCAVTKSGKCVGANRYLLRLTETDPTKLRRFDSQLVAVEEAFKNLQGDLHRLNTRIEAHIFVAFLADCPHVTLGQRLRKLALGMTSHRVPEQFAAVQMIDVHAYPTIDGRELVLTHYRQPEAKRKLLLDKLALNVPPQPPPKVTAASSASATAV